MPPRTRYLSPWTPPPFRPFPPGQRSRPAMGTGPAEAGAPGVIGNVFLTIDPLNGQALVGQRVTITGYRAGGNAPITISWAGPPGSSAPLTSTERSISWIVQAGDSGTYTATASSPGAPDDPQSAGITLTVGAAPPSTTIGLVTVTGVVVVPAEAAAYIAAVEAADGQALEEEVKTAIINFVVGCKADGTWNSLQDCCILMGARTLAGALISLSTRVSTPSTNFVAGDYDRKRLQGDGINKFLTAPSFSLVNTNLSAHWSVFLAIRDTMPLKTAYIGLDASTWWFPFVDETELWLCVNAFTATPTSAYIRVGEGDRVGFFAGSRAAGNVVSISSPLTGVETVDYVPDLPGRPATATVPNVFAIWQSGAASSHTNAGICWYSVGSTVNLGLLGPRVGALQAALATAIP